MRVVKHRSVDESAITASAPVIRESGATGQVTGGTVLSTDRGQDHPEAWRSFVTMIRRRGPIAETPTNRLNILRRTDHHFVFAVATLQPSRSTPRSTTWCADTDALNSNGISGIVWCAAGVLIPPHRRAALAIGIAGMDAVNATCWPCRARSRRPATSTPALDKTGRSRWGSAPRIFIR